MTSLPTPIDSATSLPASAIAGANVPAAVRENAPGARQAYATARSFEEMLVGQLSQSLMQSSGLTGESEGETGEGGAAASLLPQTLTEGVTRAGGLGLAAQLMHAMDPQLGAAAGSAPPSAPASAGGGAAYSPAGSLAATGGASA